MIQRSICSGRTLSSLVRWLSCAVPLGVSLPACSADSITMGEDVVQVESPLPSTSRCRESTSIDADVLVENQEQVAALEGCTEITGALTVLPFAGADLRPLHALTRVFGAVDLGGPHRDDYYGRIYATHWLESLAGLESLESAGELRVSGLAADNVDALSGLRTLGWPGMLWFDGAPNLVDLEGLSQLHGIRSLHLSYCSLLEGLEPLALPRDMDSLSFADTPLTGLTPLEVESVDQLSVTRTGLVNLDALSRLTLVSSELSITKNLELENVDALGGIESLSSFTIDGNPRLRRLPEFTELMRIDDLGIYANDSLENVPTFPKLFSDAFVEDHVIGSPLPPSYIAILYNASLKSITFSEGWFSAGRVAIWNNDALTRVEFTKQRSFEVLVLTHNPALESVELGSLDTIHQLVVFDNSLLDNAVFDSMRTFERSFEEHF